MGRFFVFVDGVVVGAIWAKGGRRRLFIAKNATGKIDEFRSLAKALAKRATLQMWSRACSVAKRPRTLGGRWNGSIGSAANHRTEVRRVGHFAQTDRPLEDDPGVEIDRVLELQSQMCPLCRFSGGSAGYPLKEHQ
jgi:hypothetical protein